MTIIDNREEMRRACTHFKVPTVTEGLCLRCGMYTINPCVPAEPGVVPTMSLGWPARGGAAASKEAKTVQMPSHKAAKTAAFSCLAGRLYATTRLSRREAQGFVSFVTGTFQYDGGVYVASDGKPVKITDDMIDDAFLSKRLREYARKRRKDVTEIDPPLEDISQSEDAWVSHWRRRALAGKIKIAPKAEIVFRQVVIYIAYISPDLTPEIDD